MAPKKESERAPWTTPGTEQPEKRPGPFAQDPVAHATQEGARARLRKRNGRQLDAVMRDTPL